MHKLLIYTTVLFLLLSGGCRPKAKSDDSAQTLYVSILPLRGIVQGIIGDDFRVEVLVPPGMSPETFEPTPRQIIRLSHAPLVFQIGWIDFEQSILSKLEERDRIVTLSEGIDPIAGTCSHAEHAGHTHGIDPHIWTSPRELRTMAANAYAAIHRLWPDSVRYTANYETLDAELQALDRKVSERIAASDVRYFMVYHPALTYYARAYGIEQVAIEQEGKEPSARRLAELIDRARRDSVRHILYQSQFPASTVEVVAEDIGAEAVAFDPLAEDITDNILRITDQITAR